MAIVAVASAIRLEDARMSRETKVVLRRFGRAEKSVENLYETLNQAEQCRPSL